jgi:hypothetical protein
MAVAMASWFGWSLIADGNDGMTGVIEKKRGETLSLQ